MVPEKEVVWFVKYNYFNFPKDKSEWTGTKISFEISKLLHDRTEGRSLAEVDTFYKQTVELDLTGDQVAALAERTEGWVAALQRIYPQAIILLS